MIRAERPGVGWALDMLWRASGSPLPPVFQPSQQLNSAPLVGLAFPLKWGMDTNDYIGRMGFIGSAVVEDKTEDLRRVGLVAFHETEWHPPQLVIDLGHDGNKVQSCNVYIAPSSDSVEIPQLRRIGAITTQWLNSEAAGQPMQQLAKYEEVVQMGKLAAATGALLLNAASMRPA